MEKIFTAILEKDEEKIIMSIKELSNPTEVVLQDILEKCESKEISDLVKREFQLLCDKAEEKKDLSSENMLNKESSDSDDLNNVKKETPVEFEDLTEEDAMKKYKFNNSKHEKAMEMFFSAFKANIKDMNNDRASFLSKAIVEQLISEFSSTFPKEVRTKSHNLKENAKLCAKIYEFVIETGDFVRMLPSEMQCEEIKTKDNEYIKDSILAAQIAKASADTDMFQCGKCKQKKCTYSQLQTRSCDEPMTTFVTCTVCGNRWKF